MLHLNLLDSYHYYHHSSVVNIFEPVRFNRILWRRLTLVWFSGYFGIYICCQMCRARNLIINFYYSVIWDSLWVSEYKRLSVFSMKSLMWCESWWNMNSIFSILLETLPYIHHMVHISITLCCINIPVFTELIHS